MCDPRIVKKHFVQCNKNNEKHKNNEHDNNECENNKCNDDQHDVQ